MGSQTFAQHQDPPAPLKQTFSFWLLRRNHLCPLSEKSQLLFFPQNPVGNEFRWQEGQQRGFCVLLGTGCCPQCHCSCSSPRIQWEGSSGARRGSRGDFGVGVGARSPWREGREEFLLFEEHHHCQQQPKPPAGCQELPGVFFWGCTKSCSVGLLSVLTQHSAPQFPRF